MPLVTPILDDRSFQQLRDELVRRIPTYTPEWTDTHPGDPGVALLELFAYLGEHTLFRFNQLPDATRIAFLRLLDIALDPPGVASGMVQFSAKDPVPALVRGGTGVRAGKVPFRTSTEVLIQPVEAVPAVRVAGVLPQDEELRALTERAVQAVGLTGTQQPVYYRLQTLAEDPTSPEAAPLDPVRSIDGAVWFAVLRRERDRQPPVLSDTTLTFGFIPARQVPPAAEVAPCPGSGTTPPSPPMVWRATTPEFVTGRLRYVPVAVVGDTTAGLTTQGTVSLRLPTGTGMPALSDPALAGTSTLPPAFGDDRDARVLLWLQVCRPETVDAPIIPLAWAGVNAAVVEQVQVAAAELLGVGTGEADQRYRLVHRGVRPGTLTVDVEESGQWCRWQQIDDLAASRAGRHYLCDLEAGEIRFGDGFRGRAPQLGQRIRVLGYQYGGGADGNVPAAAISTVEATAELTGVKVSNPWPTSGGAAAETQPEALDRIPGELRRRDRAVTSGDYRDLALRTPGGDVARAESEVGRRWQALAWRSRPRPDRLVRAELVGKGAHSLRYRRIRPDMSPRDVPAAPADRSRSTRRGCSFRTLRADRSTTGERSWFGGNGRRCSGWDVLKRSDSWLRRTVWPARVTVWSVTRELFGGRRCRCHCEWSVRSGVG